MSLWRLKSSLSIFTNDLQLLNFKTLSLGKNCFSQYGSVFSSHSWVCHESYLLSKSTGPMKLILPKTDSSSSPHLFQAQFIWSIAIDPLLRIVHNGLNSSFYNLVELQENREENKWHYDSYSEFLPWAWSSLILAGVSM